MILKGTLLLLLFILTKTCIHAQWNYSSTQNTPIDTGINKGSSNPAIVNDADGGYYITWMRRKPGVYAEICAQHIDANGIKQWPNKGIVICTANYAKLWPKIVTDGSGGAIITWQDQRPGGGNWDVYAQRVTSNGTILWPEDGVPVFNDRNDDLGPQIISDGNGGAIITVFRSSYNDALTDIFAQRIDALGTRLWPVEGVAVCTEVNRQDVPKLVSDGSGGAIIAWTDFRNYTVNATDIYAQRINAAGTAMWLNNGIPVSTMPYDQSSFAMVSDNSNGAYLVWQDFRNSTYDGNIIDIFAQRINSNGVALWAANGISVCTAAGTQLVPNVITDNDNGVQVCWWDTRFNKSAIYAQRLTPAGISLWATDGIPVCSNAGTAGKYSYPFQVSDGNNGMYVFWQDERIAGEINIYAQHLTAIGTLKWVVDGVPVCNSAGDQNLTYSDNQIANGDVSSDGHGNAVITWEDGRNLAGGWDDIYISMLADSPVILPAVINVQPQCENNSTAKAKLLNPPNTAGIAIMQDGISLNYSAADSSFIYFIGGSTTVGNHTVSIKYANFAGQTQKDSVYLVSAATIPGISISGIVSITKGQSATLSASVINGGNPPLIQWQKSKSSGTWLDIAGATSLTLVYTPLETSDKIRCVLTGTAVCSSPIVAFSNSLVFLVTAGAGQGSVNNNTVRIYPNPVSRLLYIDSLLPGDKWRTAELYTIDGKRLIIAKNITNLTNFSLRMEGFMSGTYIMMLRREDGAKMYFKVVKI